MKISGIVKKHLGRGKELGFPTANLDVKTEVEEGIYLGLAHYHTRSYDSIDSKPAIVFIGVAKTFGEKDKQVEVYILDFDYDIYGQKLEVELIKKIRDNQKFDSEQELIEQMKQDERVARQFFAGYNKSN